MINYYFFVLDEVVNHWN